MQRRFSNPNSNWYLVLIFISLLIGNILHIYSDATGKTNVIRMAQTFPANYSSAATAKTVLNDVGMLPDPQSISFDADKDFNYPKRPLECGEASGKNILFIAVDSWKSEEFDTEVTPQLSHYARHGIQFKDHHSGSNDTRGGIFSIFYSLPGAYWKIAEANKVAPVFFEELDKRKFEMAVFSSASLRDPAFTQTVFLKTPEAMVETNGANAVEKDLKVTQEWNEWITSYDNREGKGPFFGFLFYTSPKTSEFPPAPVVGKKDASPVELSPHESSVKFIDQQIREVLEGLYRKGLIDNTIVVITGDHGINVGSQKENVTPTQIVVPMLMIWPGRPSSQVSGYTSHYDIGPTIMKEEFKCKNKFSDYSYGDSLFSPRSRELHVAASGDEYGLIDYEKRQIVMIDPIGKYEVMDFNFGPVPKANAREDVILSVLRDLVKFRK